MLRAHAGSAQQNQRRDKNIRKTTECVNEILQSGNDAQLTLHCAGVACVRVFCANNAPAAFVTRTMTRCRAYTENGWLHRNYGFVLYSYVYAYTLIASNGR